MDFQRAGCTHEGWMEERRLRNISWLGIREFIGARNPARVDWNITRRKSTLDRGLVSPPWESNWRFVEVFLQAYLKHKHCSVKEICDTYRILPYVIIF